MNSLFRKKSLERIARDAAAGYTDGHGSGGLTKVLNVRDLTFMGIAAVVGAGIFSTIGQAAKDGGPGISLLFILTAVTCGFSALCYAEFASRIPIAGSAYTYAYVAFGELVAWIIGWALILEYAIGNIVVAIAWSGYFNNLLLGFNIHLPGWLITDPGTARAAFQAAQQTLAHGGVPDEMGRAAIETWNTAPLIGGAHVIMNIPAFIIVCIIASITYIGIRESKKTTNAMVIFKISVVILVIVLGCFFVKTANWSPFLPNGFSGVLKGVSAVFYAYIGFDAISTTAEECTDAQRDLPKGMIYSLLICTGLYILIALVLTGMVNYSELGVTDPLAFVFNRVHQKWIGYFISASAVVATTSVLLVFQLGQPRIWMSMSRDGLLPKAFGLIHRKYHTPWFSTIVTARSEASGATLARRSPTASSASPSGRIIRPPRRPCRRCRRTTPPSTRRRPPRGDIVPRWSRRGSPRNGRRGRSPRERLRCCSASRPRRSPYGSAATPEQGNPHARCRRRRR